LKKLAICVLLFLSASVLASAQVCASKVEGLLEQTGYTIKVLAPCRSWMATDATSIPKGDGLSGVMLIGESGDAVVIGTVLRTKARLNLSTDLAIKLLQFNHDLDWVKVGIDHDGDLFVRQELHEANLTELDVQNAFKTVAAAGEKVYAALDK
jgi:hypothetical protein